MCGSGTGLFCVHDSLTVFDKPSTLWNVKFYNAREPANIGRNNYLPPLPTFSIHFSLYSIVQCSLSHILNVISMRRPVPSLHLFCDHTSTSVRRCIPGMHLPRDASSKGRIVQGMKRSGTHRHATVTSTIPSPLLSANTNLQSIGSSKDH